VLFCATDCQAPNLTNKSVVKVIWVNALRRLMIFSRVGIFRSTFDAFYTVFFYSLTRDHVRARKEGFLRKVFQAWRGFIKETLQREMQHFATSLSGLDSSFGSFTAPPFRNVLGSTLGSTFGSTLGSPLLTMSDALTSSGYGASMRRGSGSVFTFGVLPKERDDDVSLNVQFVCRLLLMCDFVTNMRKL